MRREVTMTQAATVAKISYQRMLRLVMIGAVAGRQDAAGHWTVDATSLATWLRQNEAPMVATPEHAAVRSA